MTPNDIAHIIKAEDSNITQSIQSREFMDITQIENLDPRRPLRGTCQALLAGATAWAIGLLIVAWRLGLL